jgi:hypothetical protein
MLPKIYSLFNFVEVFHWTSKLLLASWRHTASWSCDVLAGFHRHWQPLLNNTHRRNSQWEMAPYWILRNPRGQWTNEMVGPLKPALFPFWRYPRAPLASCHRIYPCPEHLKGLRISEFGESYLLVSLFARISDVPTQSAKNLLMFLITSSNRRTFQKSAATSKAHT